MIFLLLTRITHVILFFKFQLFALKFEDKLLSVNCCLSFRLELSLDSHSFLLQQFVFFFQFLLCSSGLLCLLQGSLHFLFLLSDFLLLSSYGQERFDLGEEFPPWPVPQNEMLTDVPLKNNNSNSMGIVIKLLFIGYVGILLTEKWKNTANYFQNA